jgi:undecaprenyl pyrophosphate phosphatase UppP
MVAAALSGFLAIRLLLSYVRTRTYAPFVLYRLGFAALVWGVVLWRSGVLG